MYGQTISTKATYYYYREIGKILFPDDLIVIAYVYAQGSKRLSEGV